MCRIFSFLLLISVFCSEFDNMQESFSALYLEGGMLWLCSGGEFTDVFRGFAVCVCGNSRVVPQTAWGRFLFKPFLHDHCDNFHIYFGIMQLKQRLLIQKSIANDETRVSQQISTIVITNVSQKIFLVKIDVGCPITVLRLYIFILMDTGLTRKYSVDMEHHRCILI